MKWLKTFEVASVHWKRLQINEWDKTTINAQISQIFVSTEERFNQIITADFKDVQEELNRVPETCMDRDKAEAFREKTYNILIDYPNSTLEYIIRMNFRINNPEIEIESIITKEVCKQILLEQKTNDTRA